jgi:hypothetical protein
LFFSANSEVVRRKNKRECRRNWFMDGE